MRRNVSKLVPGGAGRSSRWRYGSVLGAVVLLSACSGGATDTSSSTAAPASSSSIGSPASSASVPTAGSSAAPSSAAAASETADPAGSSAVAEPTTAAAPAESPAPAESAEPVNPAGTTAADSAGGPCDEFVDPATVATFVPDAGPAEDFTGGDVVQRCTWTSGTGASLKVELRDALAAGLTGLQAPYLDTPVTDLPNAAAGSTLSQPAGEDPTASIQVYSSTTDSGFLLEVTWKAPGATTGALVPVAKTVLGL